MQTMRLLYKISKRIYWGLLIGHLKLETGLIYLRNSVSKTDLQFHRLYLA